MQAARSEGEGDGASDEEALFASQEEVKPPTLLAAGTGLSKKRKQLVQNGRGDGASDVEAPFAS
ncbi:hypothetical protein AT269_06350 [Bacillus cereus]|nr:hypothetical protein AT269_06350 [Bacillus cereus]